jgi:hypothetical protein
MLNKKLSLLKIVIALSFLPTSLFAGPQGSGGGKGIVCKEDEYHATVYLADTFAYFYGKDNEDVGPLESAATDLPDVDPIDILKGAAAYFDKKYPEKIYDHPDKSWIKMTLGEMIIYTFNNSLQISLVNHELPDVADDNIKMEDIPNECRQLVQIAVQNFDNKSLEVRSAYLSELLPVEIGFLWLHETLLAIRGQAGDTTPIRKKIATILATKNFEFYKNILEKIKEKKQQEQERKRQEEQRQQQDEKQKQK